jgi:hypothetical protein
MEPPPSTKMNHRSFATMEADTKEMEVTMRTRLLLLFMLLGVSTVNACAQAEEFCYPVTDREVQFRLWEVVLPRVEASSYRRVERSANEPGEFDKVWYFDCAESAQYHVSLTYRIVTDRGNEMNLNLVQYTVDKASWEIVETDTRD